VVQNYEDVTDTHLSKKYNDVLFDCIMRSNITKHALNINVHINTLTGYHSAIEIFYMNTFFLFETVTWHDPITGKDEIISKMLNERIRLAEHNMRIMWSNKKLQTQDNFNKVFQLVSRCQEMIMYGLQMRNMLVRMSSKEPRGRDSINYWGDRKSFDKGKVLDDDEFFSMMREKESVKSN